MILTKEMAEKAKEIIAVNRAAGNNRGVCWAFKELNIDLYDKDDDFWERPEDKNFKRWPCTPGGDIKRRAFIDSLIGKDL